MALCCRGNYSLTIRIHPRVADKLSKTITVDELAASADYLHLMSSQGFIHRQSPVAYILTTVPTPPTHLSVT